MVNLYFDMDGVLAKWNPNDSTEDTFQKGYFLNREPDLLMIGLANIMNATPDINVAILSAVYDNKYALEEKKQWLANQGLQDIPLINTPIGHDKADYVDKSVKSFLIDDFSENLHRWESHPNFIGIKYFNGINGTNGTWNKNCLTFTMSFTFAEHSLLKIIRGTGVPATIFDVVKYILEKKPDISTFELMDVCEWCKIGSLLFDNSVLFPEPFGFRQSINLDFYELAVKNPLTIKRFGNVNNLTSANKKYIDKAFACLHYQ